MTIQTSVPTSTRKPGTYFEFNIANAARGLAALAQRIVCVAAQHASATQAALTPRQVFSEADCDTFHGRGSELALMAKYSLRGSRDIRVPVQVWTVAIADPAGTAATHTFTVTGTATASGEIVIGIAGVVIRAAVATGDVQNTIAASIKSAIDGYLAEIPVTPGVATNVVTITNRITGANGNDVLAEVTGTVSGVTVVAAAGVAGSGVYDITAALDTLADKDYDFIAVYNHTSTSNADLAAHLDGMFAPGTKRWRQTIMAERGTLATAQALATGANDYRRVVVSAEGFRNTPGQIAAYLAGIMGGAADPALPWNNVELPSLALPNAADVPTTAEIESGIGGGLLVLSVNEQQSAAKIVRAVTTQTLLAAVPFYALLDLTIPRTMFFVARQVDVQLSLQFQRAKKNAATLRRIRSVVLGVLTFLEEIELVQNVSAHAGELVVETNGTNPDRVDVAIPTSVVPPLNQMVNVINLIVE
jgi:phage tail sheath gpL-like